LIQLREGSTSNGPSTEQVGRQDNTESRERQDMQNIAALIQLREGSTSNGPSTEKVGRQDNTESRERPWFYVMYSSSTNEREGSTGNEHRQRFVDRSNGETRQRAERDNTSRELLYYGNISKV
jgi:nicotinamide mononucleotide adenylyltransferase